MDRDDTGQGQDVAQEEAGASVAQERDTESSVMNRLIRGFGRAVGWGRDDEDRSAGDDAEQGKPAEATDQKPDPLSDPAVQAEIDRRAQSLKDREIVRLKRETATRAADAGDYAALVELAESGNEGDIAFAERELANRGATYEAGQVTARRVQAQEAAQQDDALLVTAVNRALPHLDDAYLVPLLKGLPDGTVRAIVDGDGGIVGTEGRSRAVAKALDAWKAQAAEEAATKLLSDGKFVARMLKTEGFRKSLITDPVANKQLRAFFRGELDEADLNPGVGRGGDLQRENDVMNALIRGAPVVSTDRITVGRGDPLDDE